jgi:hypothetical protein
MLYNYFLSCYNTVHCLAQFFCVGVGKMSPEYLKKLKPKRGIKTTFQVGLSTTSDSTYLQYWNLYFFSLIWYEEIKTSFQMGVGNLEGADFSKKLKSRKSV